jgi:hypothetical protein
MTVVAPPYERRTYGEGVVYRIAPHPGTEGLILALDLAALGLEPLLVLAETFTNSGEDFSFKALFEKMPPRELGALLRPILENKAAPGLIFELLKYVKRNDDSVGDKPIFDKVYSANYGELLWVLGQVIQVNRFLPQ